MIELTQEESRALAAGASPAEVVDPETGEAFVLVPAAIYASLTAPAGDGVSDAYPATDRTFAPGWEAPGMDDYDRYEELRG